MLRAIVATGTSMVTGKTVEAASHESTRPVSYLYAGALGSRWRGTALASLVIFLWVLLLQFLSGSFGRELAGYPDEPAHYMTGLMLRDYVAAGFPAPPLEYATQYYLQYPKLALGHWPPFFYCIQAGWGLLFTASRTSILILMALLTTVLAALLAKEVRGLYGTAAGMAAGCLFVSMPSVQRQTAMVMPEVLVALLGFLAAIHFGRYLETEQWKEAVWFALYSSLCILTKGNGLAIAFLPAFAIPWSRKYQVLRRSSFWRALLLVALTTLPWYLLTARFARHVWTADPADVTHAAWNVLAILTAFAFAGGLPLFVAAILGILATVLLPGLRRQPASGLWASMLALLVATWLLNAVVPLEVETRKLLMGFPPMVMLAAAGIFFLIRKLQPAGVWAQAIPVIVLGAGFIQNFTIPEKPPMGFMEAAKAVMAQDTGSTTYLVSATASGQGAFITEVAMRDPERRRYVVRANQALATTDWNGDGYQLLFGTTEEIRDYLEHRSISVIVIEDTPALQDVEHHALLTRMLEEHPGEWIPVTVQFPQPSSSNPVKVFRRAGLQRPPASRESQTISEKPF